MREEREKLLLDLLRDNWNSSNTYGLTPDISFGWFDERKDQPQITIPQPDEGPINGGSTGYSGLNPTTGELHQDRTGTIDVNIWTEYSTLRDSSATSDNPRQYNAAVKEEMFRIVREHGFNPTNPQTSENPVWSLAPGSSNRVPEPDESDLEHYTASVQYHFNTASGG